MSSVELQRKAQETVLAIGLLLPGFYPAVWLVHRFPSKWLQLLAGFSRTRRSNRRPEPEP